MTDSTFHFPFVLFASLIKSFLS